jgi:hypothetical protein
MIVARPGLGLGARVANSGHCDARIVAAQLAAGGDIGVHAERDPSFPGAGKAPPLGPLPSGTERPTRGNIDEFADGPLSFGPSLSPMS